MDNYDWESVPNWGAGGKRFEVMADDTSGRIPVTKIERWQNFAEMLDDSLFNQNGTQLVFRGHRRFDWSLLPTLGRLTENGIISDELADQQLDLFRKAVRGRIKDTSLVDEGQEDELWSIGQHHGLMTPLLDWTYSPYVGLFFAFAKEDQKGEEDNPYRVVYVLNKTFVDDDGQCPDIRVMEPRKDDHGRLVNQAGLFTFSPTDATIENKLIETISDFEEFKEEGEETEAEYLAQYICKIYIRNEAREECLKALRRMNVHHASLFPDLLGASDYCNILMEEEQRVQAIADAAAGVEADEQVVMSDFAEAEVVHAEEPVDESEAANLVELLSSTEGAAQVEPGRIQLIANQLAKELKKNKVVDWESRDSVQAKLRNVARVTLRKYGYPMLSRE
ncbi:MAG: FRG domain-containing protein, partial [Desulfuromonadales bacterium]|nr:FRG domain-containing protein [Desulfuromonadales bacterium]